MFEDCEKKPTDCCAAPGWVELKRERLDKTKRQTINLCSERKTDRIPCHTWKGYNGRQHWADILKRDYIKHTVI